MKALRKRNSMSSQACSFILLLVRAGLFLSVGGGVVVIVMVGVSGVIIILVVVVVVVGGRYGVISRVMLRRGHVVLLLMALLAGGLLLVVLVGTVVLVLGLRGKSGGKLVLSLLKITLKILVGVDQVLIGLSEALNLGLKMSGMLLALLELVC